MKISGLNLILMGPPGAGKGTQSELIVSKYNIVHLSTGDMFREAYKNKTKTGLLAHEFTSKGQLVPDDVTIALVKERLLQDDCKNGYLLDGFPRTIEQAEALDEFTNSISSPISKVIALDADYNELVKRITSRRVCPVCGASYNLFTKRPLVEGVCDHCQSKLVPRDDDTEAKLHTRLEAYEKQTKPLLDYYAKKGLLVKVDGLQEIEKVFADIAGVLGE